MQIMLDANIIVSAILFPQSIISKMIKHMVLNHKLILSQYTIGEIKEVFHKKFKNRVYEMDDFLEKLPYELFSLAEIKYKKYPNIRDVDDLPVLVNAIESSVDLLVTGDKDFDGMKTKGLKILKPKEYVDGYM